MDSLIFNENQNINIIEDEILFNLFNNDEPLGNCKQDKEKNENSKILKSKRKNAEFSKQTRLRKKIEVENLRKENQFLKQKIQFLEKKLNQHLCNECKSKILPFFKSSINNNNNSKKKIFFFTTSITIILIYFCFFNNNQTDIKNHLRKLRYQYEKDILVSSDYVLNSTITSKGIYLRYGDYYSIIHHNNFLNNNTEFSIKNKIKRINEYNLNEDLFPENCEGCLVKLNENCLKVIGPFKFSLFLTPGYINTPLYNKTYENITINGNKYFTYYEFEMTGYSINKAIIANNHNF